MLPHFGPETSHARLFGLGPRLEALGFTSAWARDQLGFRGGLPFEPRSLHFVDPFIALSAIAASSNLTVGTATLVPIRQPLIVAQLVGSLAYLARGRFILGIGLGGVPRAFELAGVPWAERVELCAETIAVIRSVAHPHASFAGRFAQFDDLTLDPAPPADLDIWFSGTSPGAVRISLERATGWFPGRIPLTVFDRLLRQLHEGEAGLGRTLHVGIMPIVSLDSDRTTALERINVTGLLEEARSKASWRADGPFESPDDLRGMVLAGTVEDIVVGLRELSNRGVSEVVLDLRQRMDVFDETLVRIGEEVLPALASSS